MTKRNKLLITIACLSVILCTMITGTIAWLTDKTGTVTNTFTPSKIDIDLVETKGGDNREFKMVPGATIEKDPKVTVGAGSEACYVFVKFEKTNNLDNFITYTKADGWTQLDGVTEEIYYRKVGTASSVQEFPVLNGNAVTVSNTVTKGMMEGLTSAQYPTLTFTASAIQSDYLNYGTAATEQEKALVAWITLNG